MSDRVVAVVTQHLLDELAAVLARPKFRRWLSLADAVAFVEALGGKADLQPDPGPPPQRVRDPKDDYLVALAHAVGAVVVTGDADLLEATLDPPAATPRALLDALARCPNPRTEGSFPDGALLTDTSGESCWSNPFRDHCGTVPDPRRRPGQPS